jgi:hypothetical protein
MGDTPKRGGGERVHVTQNVTNYQGLPPLISPNTKQEISPLPQLMKKPPVDEPDMCATTSTDADTQTHTYSQQHGTACSAVVRFLPIRLSVNKAKKKSLNALTAHARTLPFLCKSQRTLFTASPVGAVSVQGYIRIWVRYVACQLCAYILHIRKPMLVP